MRLKGQIAQRAQVIYAKKEELKRTNPEQKTTIATLNALLQRCDLLITQDWASSALQDQLEKITETFNSVISS